MDGHRFLNLEDKKEWVDSDLVRLPVIWTYGGAWIDMDVLITRDLSPLLKHEFVMQWNCYGNPITQLSPLTHEIHRQLTKP
jgi:mannosyltransferase OCH1-like enzyme